MLHMSHREDATMPKGASGRLVIEIDTSLKHQLYVALAEENQTLKSWFLSSASEFLKRRQALAAATERPEAESSS